ncbi:nitrous oxide reductase accessory protein NosL [uncultured Ferrovibrio sp.]|jgi:copper chaperone NosL|uniref:nitrous oxide reductase accessory protein NosL n=1 Tax=uncultured Ferrovibrio sp. TaxID=1576913 RepID=UPI0026131176|nr:nitrous oxide reductase accessory protein NosL [uncultured Ferrovibrio sp.]
MKRFAWAALILAAGLLAGCKDEASSSAPPPPHVLTADAIGNYCGMNVLEHPGPKAQILLTGWPEPIWFSSARDAFAFTMLPEEAKNIAAIYVSDMARAESWENPGIANWIEARQASFVIGSDMRSGMGAAEAVPFGDRAAAERFAAQYGGRIVSFSEVPSDYILGSGQTDGHSVLDAPPQRLAERQEHHVH